jgi:hypothetical protein
MCPGDGCRGSITPITHVACGFARTFAGPIARSAFLEGVNEVIRTSAREAARCHVSPRSDVTSNTT